MESHGVYSFISGSIFTNKTYITGRQTTAVGERRMRWTVPFPPQEAPGLFLFWLTDHQKRKAERAEYCGWKPHELTLEN